MSRRALLVLVSAAVVVLGLADAGAAGATRLSNEAPIVFSDGASAPGSPSPSSVNVAGLGGQVTDVDVEIHSLSHTFPDDIALVLKGPGGQTLLMADSGGGPNCDGERGGGASGLAITFDDSASEALPNNAPPTGGTFKPSRGGGGDNCGDTAPDPFPTGPDGTYAATLSEFNGEQPNGTWSLYALDDTDGDGGQIQGGWTLDIKAVTPPSCADLLDVAGRRDTPTQVPLSCTDADGDGLTLAISSQPQNGTLGPIDPTTHEVTYTPEPGYVGPDVFEYRATDTSAGGLQSNVAKVTLDVVAPRPPVCANLAGVAHDAPATVALSCTDPDGDTLTLSAVSGPAHGTLGPIDQATGRVTYTPAAGYAGPDAFTYKAVDVQSEATPATVSMTVAAAPPPPPPPPPAAAPPARPPAAPPARRPATPRLSAAVLRPSVFRTVRRRGHPVGSELTIRLSTPSAIRGIVQRRTTGRRSGRSCQAPKRSNRRGKRCSRWQSMSGALTIAKAGKRVSVRFSGRLKGRALKSGRYQLVLTPRASGARARRVGFRITK